MTTMTTMPAPTAKKKKPTLKTKTLYVLYLNDMRSAKIEYTQISAWASDRAKLEAFIETETVELYRDGRYAKTFRKGGPLEWFNRPYDLKPDAWPPDPGSIQEAQGAVVDGCVWVTTELTKENNADFREMS